MLRAVRKKNHTAIPHIRALTHYAATDEHERDVGDSVWQRATLVCEMLSDESVLEAERTRGRELQADLQGGTGACGSDSSGLSSGDYHASLFHPSTF